MGRPRAPDEAKEVRLKQSSIRYREAGAGESIMLGRGLLVSRDYRRLSRPRAGTDARCFEGAE